MCHRALRVAICLFAVVVSARAQDANLRIEVRADGTPVPEAAVVVNKASYVANVAGVAFATVASGSVEIVVVKEGFAPVTVSLTLAAGEQRTIRIDLEPQAAIEEHVTVSATRTDKRLEDQPMRVEVLDVPIP